MAASMSEIQRKKTELESQMPSTQDAFSRREERKRNLSMRIAVLSQGKPKYCTHDRYMEDMACTKYSISDCSDKGIEIDVDLNAVIPPD